MSTFFRQTAQAMIAKHIDRDLRKKALPRQPKTCVWVSAVGEGLFFVYQSVERDCCLVWTIYLPPRNGLMTFNPAAVNGVVSRVATVIWW